MNKEYNEQVDKLKELKVKERQLQSDLKSAYDYKEDLIEKMKFADKQITHKQREYHRLLNDTQLHLAKAKIALDLEFTV